MQYTPLGDQAVTITLGDAINVETHRRVRAVAAHLDANPPRGMLDLVPAFLSVAVHYDPARIDGSRDESPYARIVAELERSLAAVRPEQLDVPRVVEIPVCYGGALGPDLDDVARLHGMDADDIIRIHAAGDYLVYMIGFMPGFAYLGGLSDEIITPRRASPRTAVPAGTVGIGGEQTGVYPLESPGGWHLIGRTPLRVFDISRAEPSLLATGDRVRFRPIDEAAFRAWEHDG
jgi:inhibitor of KinA